MAFNSDFFQNLRNSKKFMYPILVTIILAAFLSIIVNTAYTETPEDITPVPGPSNPGEEPEEAFLAALINAIIYVGIALIGGFLLVYLIRSGKAKILELVFASMMGFSTFIFGLYVLPAIPYLIFISFPEIVSFLSVDIASFIINEVMLVINAFLGILSFLVLGLRRFKSQKVHNTLMILFGAFMGVVLGRHIPAYILFIILIALALYDIYAVFYGPIKQMFTPSSSENNNTVENPKNLSSFKENQINEKTEINEDTEKSSNRYYTVDQTGNPNHEFQNDSEKPEYYEISETLPISLPVYYTPEISIGLGDFVFFSVLVSKSIYEGLISNNFWLFILPLIGILIGSYYTFRLLEKREILPALPIPIFAGTIGFVLSLILGNLPILI